MKSERQPRTIRIERVSTYLLGNPIGPPTSFVLEAREFRRAWGLPPDGLSLFDVTSRPGLARIVHEFWTAFNRVAHGAGSERESRLVNLLLPDPVLAMGDPTVRQALGEEGYDLAWMSRLHVPADYPGALAYERELQAFIDRTIARYGCVENLRADAHDLLLDLVYQPSLLIARLVREYRLFDYLREPDDSMLPLLHTFTAILPDASLTLGPGNTRLNVGELKLDPETGRPHTDAVSGEPVVTTLSMSAFGNTKPGDVLIHYRAGISRNALRDLADEVARAVADKQGLFADLDPRDLALERRTKRRPNDARIDRTELARELARIHAGESRAQVVNEILERMGQHGRTPGITTIDKALRELEKEGFLPRTETP